MSKQYGVLFVFENWLIILSLVIGAFIAVTGIISETASGRTGKVSGDC